MDAQKKLRVLRDRWTGCTKCGLSKLRGSSEIIFGSGSYNSDFLLLIEGPTESDTSENMLLTGDEGQLVEDMLERAGIDSRKNVFFASVVACRPYVILPATEEEPARAQARGPAKDEVEACLPRVQEIIYLVDPRLILVMGDEPWKSLVPPKARGRHNTITTAAGELFDTFIPGRLRPVRYPVMATLAPKQLIANPSAATHGPISTTIEAFMKANHYITTLKKKEETK